MTSSLTFDRTGTDVGLWLSALAGQLDVKAAELVLRAAEHVVGEIRAVVSEKFPEGRTGKLGRSFRATFLGRDGGAVSAAATSDLVYARIQDEGGVIRPSSVKYLAIPLKRLPVGKWPRHFGKGELVLVKSRSGGAVLAKVSKRGKVDPVFALKKSVRIPGKRYLDAAAERAAPGVEEIMAEGYRRLVEEQPSGTAAVGGGGG